MTTKDSILHETSKLLASEGAAGTSMRKVASAVGIEPSVIYNYFSDKESLLRATRIYLTIALDEELRSHLQPLSTEERLLASIRFQLAHRERIVALLQYFMAARADFPLSDHGYVPSRAYQHMTDLLTEGIQKGIYECEDVLLDAKTITHLVNGYLMEYYDREMSDKQMDDLSHTLHHFIERAITRRSARRAL